jgi:hypothetical protein
MSAGASVVGAMTVMAPVVERVRAYFAPVNRVAQQAAVFDVATVGGFGLSAPPAPWVDLGWIDGFERKSATKVEPVRAGAPLVTQLQARTEIDARVSFSFESWGKLQMALACGTQQLNVLAEVAGATSADEGGVSAGAVALAAGSTAQVLQMEATDAAKFVVGQWVAVDVDYAGQLGFVGSGASGAYVQSALTDVDYVRRVTLNVARVVSVTPPAAGATVQTTAVALDVPLLAGVPVSGMKASAVVGFCDREGSSYFQEWSGVFVAEGQQGERVVWLYPRLQAMSGVAESVAKSSGGYVKVRQAAGFRALPVKDALDGETVVCYRSLVVG